MSPLRGTVVLVCVAFLVAAAARPASADEVRFRNGDRLTGKVTSIDGGKLKLKTTALGDVSIDLSEIKTFSTDSPIGLRLKDGTTMKQPVSNGPDGAITVGPAGGDLKPLPLDQLHSAGRDEKWKGSLTVGGVITRGDSEKEQLNAGFEVTRRTSVDRARVEGGYFYGRERDPDTGSKDTTTDNWFVFGKYDRFFTSQLYGLAVLRVDKDRIADLDLRLVPSIGVGYQWVETPTTDVNVEAGLAYVHEEYSVPNNNEDHLAARFAYRLEHDLSDQVTVFHDMNYFPSLNRISDYNLITDAGIRANLTGHMFTEFKLEWKLDSTPAPGASRSDLRYLLSVGWKF